MDKQRATRRRHADEAAASGDDAGAQPGAARVLAPRPYPQRPAARGTVATRVGLALDTLALGWLDRDHRPRLAINREREILWANSAAKHMLRAPQPVHIKRKCLCFADAIDSEACDAFLESATEEVSRLPVLDEDEGHFAVMSAWAEEIVGRRVVFIEVALADPPLSVRSSGMARQFGLTPSESAVVDALVRLEPPAAIARRLGVSIHTVRTHIRRVYGKLAVRSQSQLMRLALAYGGG